MKHFLVFASLILLIVSPVRGEPGEVEGSIEAGLGSGFGGNQRHGLQWMLDNVDLKTTMEISDTTKIFIHNAFSGTNVSPQGNLYERVFNTNQYYNSTQVATQVNTQTGETPVFTFANQEAYVEHRCSEDIYFRVGNFRNVFGMESLKDRYAMSSYYYSAAYTQAQNIGWTYNLGLKLAFENIGPGNLEITVFNNLLSRTHLSPGTAVRLWLNEIELANMSLQPVTSAYAGRWRGGPKDFGLAAGAIWKMGVLWAEAEVLFTLYYPDPGSSAGRMTVWSFYVEPGLDFGLAILSVKLDFTSESTPIVSDTGMNLAAMLTKNFGKFRTRLGYYNNNGNEIRLLFGTDF